MVIQSCSGPGRARDLSELIQEPARDQAVEHAMTWRTTAAANDGGLLEIPARVHTALRAGQAVSLDAARLCRSAQ